MSHIIDQEKVDTHLHYIKNNVKRIEEDIHDQKSKDDLLFHAKELQVAKVGEIVSSKQVRQK